MIPSRIRHVFYIVGVEVAAYAAHPKHEISLLKTSYAADFEPEHSQNLNRTATIWIKSARALQNSEPPSQSLWLAVKSLRAPELRHSHLKRVSKLRSHSAGQSRALPRSKRDALWSEAQAWCLSPSLGLEPQTL